jgi:hypothetical protein
MLVSFWAAGYGLPLDISAQTLAGCKLEVLPTVILPGTTTTVGTLSQSLPIPIDPSNLTGFHVYCQFGYMGRLTTGITQGLDINIH